MRDDLPEMSDEALGRQLGAELPRYAAPAHLRAAIAEAGAEPSRRPVWLTASVAAAATALALLLFVVPVLPQITPADPVQRLVRAVVAEHMRALMWGTRRGDVIPTALPWLTQESGIGLASVFSGDERLTLVAAEPVYLERRRGMAVHYRDGDGHLVSYVVLPAPGLALPDRSRVQIDRFKPVLVHDSGFAAWVWKHGELACFLVSDMISEADLEHFKEYFVSVRAATEPFPAY